MLRRRASILSFACMVAACSSGGSSPDAAVQPRLCDGLQHLRLWALMEPMPDVVGGMVRTENGFPFLAVDGTCAYWVGGGWVDDSLARDRPIHTGQLTGDQIQLLEENVPVSDVTPLGDCPPFSGISDSSTRAFHTSTGQVTCASRGTRFDRAWTTAATLASALWDTGTPLSGAIHVSAVSAFSPPPPAPYSWPLSVPLSSFLLHGNDLNMAGVSQVVDDPVQAAALRALRDQYLQDRTAQPGLYVNWDGLQVTDQGATAFVYLRDALPYEGPAGLLQF